MRRLGVVFLLALALPGAAQAATLSLGVQPGVARPGATVTLAGGLAPAQAGVPVGIYAGGGSAWQLVAQTATEADGTYRVSLTARQPTSYRALAQVDATTQAASAAVALVLRPTLTVRVAGKRSVGARLLLTGRLLPANAGRVTLTFRGRTSRVAVGRVGHFSALLPSDAAGRAVWRLRLAPAAGFEATSRSKAIRLRAPRLAYGDVGLAVRALESRLASLRYAVRGVDGRYGSDTYEAVMAFQKVHGLPRTGRVDARFWRRLTAAGVPRAFVPSGTHIEISKTKQVMYEVVNGKVVRAVHVSTGLTGNTPVGRFRVYRLGPGYNALGMYYSLYFLRGFAIHGYRSVPPYPASHGCIRTPTWFAPGFYRRWARLGTEIRIFP